MYNDNYDAVKIAVLERPTEKYMKENIPSSVITYHPSGNNIIVNETVFTFDHVLGPDVTQKEIFDSLIKPLLVKLKLGFNCTALAYGQTGTGKSYTMGLSSKNFEGDDIGVIPCCLKELFLTVQESADQLDSYKQIEISASFIEIYNEKVYDLLRENTNEPISVKGQKYTGGSRKPLFNIDECNALLMQGNKNRHVRPTKMNSQSSRSHAIFTIYVCSKFQNANDEFETMSCMNIVDLAGSEGVRRTGHQGMAMSEGVHINQGLLSIGKVLQAMTTGSKVIPYRDSVLSSVLQDSLNSNSYLTLLACISPHREDLSETLSTLRFAQNAKQLKNTPEVKNIIADIKKNAKLKQTPYKVKPLQVKNSKATNLKPTLNNVYGTQTKSAIKSNTFCTPKKQRIELKKCNQTMMVSNYERVKDLNIAMNLPHLTQLESTHNRESMLNRSIDSNGSLLSLNMSTSTAFEGRFQKQHTNLSPIVRKCMAELQNNLEDNLTKMFEKNVHTLISQTPALSHNYIGFPSTVRQEFKNIIKEILSEENASAKGEDSEKDTNKSINKITKPDARCQLFNSSNELFKIPEIPPIANRPQTSSPIEGTTDSSIISDSFSQNFFSDKTVVNKSIRRSVRISERHQPRKSQNAHNMSMPKDNLLLRRSSRKSVLEMYQNKKCSCIPPSNLSSSVDEKYEETIEISNSSKKSNKYFKSNSTRSSKIIDIDSNSDISTPSNAKKALTKHRKAILDLLNKGSIKDLQFLPQIGTKTAYQIVTQRNLITLDNIYNNIYDKVFTK